MKLPAKFGRRHADFPQRAAVVANAVISGCADEHMPSESLMEFWNDGMEGALAPARAGQKSLL